MVIEKQNLQDTFLNKIRTEKEKVTIFLVNGIKLEGIVTWFDNFTLLLRRDTQIQLIYKHSIATILIVRPISLYEEEIVEQFDRY